VIEGVAVVVGLEGVSAAVVDDGGVIEEEDGRC
jgi:hypothetical protein